MNNDRTIPTAESQDLATQTIKINGEEISRTYQVMNLIVTKEINRISSARLVLTDGEASSSDFPASNSDLFVPGNEIEILAGYHSDEEIVFKGIVIKQSIKIRTEGASKLIVECRDAGFKTASGRKSKYFYESTDAEIIEEILGDYDLETDVSTTSVTHAELVQYDTTDWDFIISRAEVNGLVCLIDDGKVTLLPPEISDDPELTLEYGATLLEFDGEIDARNQFSAIKSKSWDPVNQEILEVEGNAPDVTPNGNISGDELAENIGLNEYVMPFGGGISEQALQSWADSRLLQDRLSKVRGRAKFQGVPFIKPTSTVALQGVGERFNGNCFVSGVRHTITNGQWTTDIQFGLDPEWFAKKVKMTERFDIPLNTVKGLQIGVVVQLEDDPDGEDRVLVTLPIIDPQEEGVWARLSCLDAGNERGTFFRPEVNDEVIVGFVNDDPLNAVILGMLHSSGRPTPQAITAENNEKGYITRSELKFLFDDDKKSITMETPAGKKVVIDEDSGSIMIEDENNNKVLLDDSGVTIESGSDLNLKASGDINLEGANISAVAQQNFVGEGSLGAELTSSATVTVQGSLVQIN